MSNGYGGPLAFVRTHSETGDHRADAALNRQRRMQAAEDERAALDARAAEAGRTAIAQHYWEQERSEERAAAEQDRARRDRARQIVLYATGAQTDTESFVVACESVDVAVQRANAAAEFANKTSDAALIEGLMFAAPDGAVQTLAFRQRVQSCGMWITLNRACVTGV